MTTPPHRPARELRRALTALGLTLTIFAVPLWTIAAHEPSVEDFTPVPTPDRDRIAQFVMTLPPEPEHAITEDSRTEDARTEDARTEDSRTEDSRTEDTVKALVSTESAPPPTPLQATRTSPAPKPRVALALHKKSPAQAQPKTSRTARKGRKKARDCRPDVPEITRGTGRQDYAVNRSLIDRYAKDLDAAADLAHVAWAHDDNDRVIGFKVIRIRCGSPLHEAGFKNGDIITRINGHKVRTVPQALAAYVALRIKRKLRVRGHREDGSQMDLRYRLT